MKDSWRLTVNDIKQRKYLIKFFKYYTIGGVIYFGLLNDQGKINCQAIYKGLTNALIAFPKVAFICQDYMKTSKKHEYKT